MNKMTGECTEDLFWEAVAAIGWGTETTDSGAVKSKLLDLWDDDFIASFRGLLHDYESRLYHRVEKYERANDVSCGQGDDGFGDLIAHCVGLGKEHYMSCLDDPGLVVKRGHAKYGTPESFVENFGYCIPYAPIAPKETVEEAVAKIRKEREERGYDDERLDEDALLMEAYSRVMGDKAHKEPRYYGAWARRQKVELEALMDSEFGVQFGVDLPFVVGAFTDVAKNEPEHMLERAEKVKAALGRIEAKRRELIEEFRRRTAVVEGMSYWGCRNMVTDIEENFGGEE